MEVKQRRSAMNVLVVEDSRTQAEFIRQILETAGYNVILAGNGFLLYTTPRPRERSRKRMTASA